MLRIFKEKAMFTRHKNACTLIRHPVTCCCNILRKKPRAPMWASKCQREVALLFQDKMEDCDYRQALGGVTGAITKYICN